MNDFWFETTAQVQALSPVHVGSGKKLNQLTYVYTGDKILVMDEERLLSWASSNERVADQFVAVAERGGNIGEFLAAQHVTAEPFALYSLGADLTRPPRDIAEFIKTMDSRPYLPGSSLKGVLRNALLRGAVLADEKLADSFSRTVIDLAEKAHGRRKASGSEEIQARVFVPNGVERGKYSNYDLNRAFVIADSAPLPLSRLRLYEARMLSLQYNNRLEFKARGSTPVSVFIEAIRPKAIFNLPLRRDLRLLKGQGAAAELGLNDPRISRLMVHLTEYCRAAGFEILEQELNFYQRHQHYALAGWFEAKRDALRGADGIFILPMGWGSGYDAKTVTDLLSYEAYEAVAENHKNTSGLGRPGNDNDNDWLGPDDSPKSRKVIFHADGTLEPVGWVVVKLTPVGQPSAAWEDLTQTVETPDFGWLYEVDEEAALPKVEIRISISPVPIDAEAEDEVEDEDIEDEGESDEPAGPDRVAELARFTLSFLDLPTPGDRFKGSVYYTDAGKVFVIIPGLSPDDIALAWVSLTDLPADQQDIADGDILTCEVVELTPEKFPEGYMMVHCKPC